MKPYLIEYFTKVLTDLKAAQEAATDIEDICRIDIAIAQVKEILKGLGV